MSVKREWNIMEQARIAKESYESRPQWMKQGFVGNPDRSETAIEWSAVWGGE
jgi:hypothetical protein